MALTLLDLGPKSPDLTKSQREKGLRNAIRAERLLDNPDMQWWLGEPLLEEEKSSWEQLLKAPTEKLADEARGSIKVLRRATRRLQFMAKQRKELEELLND